MLPLPAAAGGQRGVLLPLPAAAEGHKGVLESEIAPLYNMKGAKEESRLETTIQLALSPHLYESLLQYLFNIRGKLPVFTGSSPTIHCPISKASVPQSSLHSQDSPSLEDARGPRGIFFDLLELVILYQATLRLRVSHQKTIYLCPRIPVLVAPPPC